MITFKQEKELNKLKMIGYTKNGREYNKLIKGLVYTFGKF